MNTSDSTPDDSHWSSLAHELGLDSDPTPANPPPPEPQATPLEVSSDHVSHHDLPDAADEEDTTIEPGLNADPAAENAESEEASGEEGGDEGGKRRRRRRRRRRKGGENPTSPAAEGGEESPEEETADEEEPVEAPAHAAMHDVVANWNVPSWDELIGGLYRPGS